MTNNINVIRFPGSKYTRLQHYKYKKANNKFHSSVVVILNDFKQIQHIVRDIFVPDIALYRVLNSSSAPSYCKIIQCFKDQVLCFSTLYSILHSSVSYNFYCNAYEGCTLQSSPTNHDTIPHLNYKTKSHTDLLNNFKMELGWSVLCIKMPRRPRLQITPFLRRGNFCFPLYRKLWHKYENIKFESRPNMLSS